MNILDAHCDTLSTGRPLLRNNGHFDFERAGRVGGGQVMAAFGPDKERQLARLAAETPGAPAGYRLVAAVEGADELLCEADYMALTALGIRLLGLTWNHDNALAGGCGGTGGGLTRWGAEIVKLCERDGVLVDLAHASRRTFEDVLAMARRPAAVTHACCASLHPHRRNLDDSQLRRVALSGGVVGITYYTHFLCGAASAPLETLVAHIVHAVNVAGEDAVGLGSDFDGCDCLPDELCGVQDVPRLIERLPMSDRLREKIASGNWARLLV